MAGRIAYYGNIATQGLVLNLDAAIQGSYPKTGSTWFDISNNGNNGTLTNGPLYTGSNYGALVFNGNNTYVNCGNAGSLKITGPITLNSFFKANAFNVDYQPIIAMGDDSYRLQRHYSTSKLAFGSRNIGLTDLTSSTSIITGSWYNATAVYDGSFMNLYINGAPNSKGAASGNLPASNYNLYVGSNQQFPTRTWSGSIATAQVYNQALTQFQVWQNFNAYKSRYGIPDIVTDGLVLNLDAGNPYSYLSGSSGTTWTNTVAVSSSISGTLENGTAYSNGAMVFDGSDDYVKITSSVVLNEPKTMEAWIYITSHQVRQVLSRNFDNYEMYTFRDGFVYTYWGSAFNTSVNKPPITLNAWNHFCFTLSGTTEAVYKNGTLVGTRTLNTSPVYTNTGDLNIGRRNSGTQYLDGRISNVSIYNRALSAAEVQQNFNALRGRYGI